MNSAADRRTLPPRGLVAIHSLIGLRQQLLVGRAVIGEHGGARAQGQPRRPARTDDQFDLAEPALQFVPPGFGHLGGAIRQDDDEFVARIADAQVVRPEQLLQFLGDCAQGAVADAVSVGVVDHLEAVDVHDNQSDFALQSCGAR